MYESIISTPRFRLYPTEQQRQDIDINIAASRFVYNRLLYISLEARRLPEYYDLTPMLPTLKEEFPQLKKADSAALQSAAKHLARAFKYYRYRDYNKPHRRREDAYRQTYRTTGRGNCIAIKQDGDKYYVKLPKITPIKFKLTQQPANGRIVSAIVTREGTDKYYISFYIQLSEALPALPRTGRAIGLDLGLHALITTSEGEQIQIEDYYALQKDKLDILHEKLLRQTKGSKRWRKTYNQFNKLWRHIQNQRKDAIHKITTTLVRDYDIICVEDLAVRDLIDRNTFLKNDIKNAMWGEVLRQLDYKTKKYGKTLIKVDRYFPSSQICSACWFRWSKLHDCSIRAWTCPNCGTYHPNRDVNAAQNILREGLRIYRMTP